MKLLTTLQFDVYTLRRDGHAWSYIVVALCRSIRDLRRTHDDAVRKLPWEDTNTPADTPPRFPPTELELDLAGLPPKTREVLALSLDGYSIAQIALKLSKSRSAVKNQLREARRFAGLKPPAPASDVTSPGLGLRKLIEHGPIEFYERARSLPEPQQVALDLALQGLPLSQLARTQGVSPQAVIYRLRRAVAKTQGDA